MGSGAILTEVLKAADLLTTQGYVVDIVSVTSWSELARSQDWIAKVLSNTRGPIVAATDYVRAVPESVREFIPEGRKFKTLGTDGFGRSDTRSELRKYFQVDSHSIVGLVLKMG
jgi:pyruvate dehydrogenase E1 component